MTWSSNYAFCESTHILNSAPERRLHGFCACKYECFLERSAMGVERSLLDTNTRVWSLCYLHDSITVEYTSLPWICTCEIHVMDTDIRMWDLCHGREHVNVSLKSHMWHVNVESVLWKIICECKFCVTDLKSISRRKKGATRHDYRLHDSPSMSQTLNHWNPRHICDFHKHV